jgi:phosphonate transport system substrate-binding protein
MDLPPSLGREPVLVRARALAALLYDVGFEMVAPASSYGELEERLQSGETDAAWGPPLVCARVEAAGGRVALRGLRGGSASYRAVLIARALDRMDLTQPGANRRRPRAVWVDRESMAGYILPRALLASLGFDLKTLFVSERFLGSFSRCVDAVLAGDADLTSTFAPSAGADGPDGYMRLAGPRAAELKTLGYTADTPNDGIVLSSRLQPPTADAMQTALRRLLADPEHRRVLAEAFDVSGFEEPPPGAYAPLLALHGSAVA